MKVEAQMLFRDVFFISDPLSEDLILTAVDIQIIFLGRCVLVLYRAKQVFDPSTMVGTRPDTFLLIRSLVLSGEPGIA